MFEDGLQNFLELLQVFKVYHNCERSLLFLPQWSLCCVVCYSVSKIVTKCVCACFNPQNKVEGQCSKLEDLRNKMFQGEPFICFFC
jgi:hypothetical protein